MKKAGEDPAFSLTAGFAVCQPLQGLIVIIKTDEIISRRGRS
jgi:hypothetical protein